LAEHLKRFVKENELWHAHSVPYLVLKWRNRIAELGNPTRPGLRLAVWHLRLEG
jgi:hypothetical protein